VVSNQRDHVSFDQTSKPQSSVKRVEARDRELTDVADVMQIRRGDQPISVEFAERRSQVLSLIGDGNSVQPSRPKRHEQSLSLSPSPSNLYHDITVRPAYDRTSTTTTSVDSRRPYPPSEELCEEFLYDIKGGLRPPRACGRRFAPSSAGNQEDRGGLLCRLGREVPDPVAPPCWANR